MLDWLGAIGGLAGALKALFAAAIIVFQFKASINYVGNHTYKVRKGEDIDQTNKIKTEGEIKVDNDDKVITKRIEIGFFLSIK